MLSYDDDDGVETISIIVFDCRERVKKCWIYSHWLSTNTRAPLNIISFFFRYFFVVFCYISMFHRCLVWVYNKYTYALQQNYWYLLFFSFFFHRIHIHIIIYIHLSHSCSVDLKTVSTSTSLQNNSFFFVSSVE